MELEATRKVILEMFVESQVGVYDSMPYVYEGAGCLRYRDFTDKTGLPLDVLKQVIHSLRDQQLVELRMTVNYDCMPSGSGWFLTEKGLEYALSLGIEAKE